MAVVEIAGRKAELRDCPLCGEAERLSPESPYSEKPWAMKRCRHCGFVYLNAAPLYEELVEDYSWDKTAVDWHQRRKAKYPILYRLSKSTRWRLHLFKRKRVEDILYRYVNAGNVIDVGCGKGAQLRQLSDTYVPFGIEISQVEAAHALEWVKQRGRDVIVKSARDGLRAFPENFAAGVFMRSFLEHEMYPKAVLRETARVLQSRGIAIIKIPNYGCVNRMVLGRKWPGFRFPDHLNYFTPQTLLAMCRQCGLSIRRFGLTDRFPFNDNMWLIAGKN